MENNIEDLTMVSDKKVDKLTTKGDDQAKTTPLKYLRNDPETKENIKIKKDNCDQEKISKTSNCIQNGLIHTNNKLEINCQNTISNCLPSDQNIQMNLIQNSGIINIKLDDCSQEVYEKLGNHLFHLNEDLQPVQVVAEFSEYISDKLTNKFLVGERLEDIYQLKSDNSFVLISNNIHPMQTNGFVTKFFNFDQLPLEAINLDHGLANSMCIKDENLQDVRIFVGFDSGNIASYNSCLNVLSDKSFCHNIITKVKLNPQQNKLICADLDGRLVLIDFTDGDLEALTYYDYAHCDGINDFVFDSIDNNLIISGGSDNDILIWDFRIPTTDKPATLLTHVTTQPTSLYWPSKNELIFGTEAGNVVQFDIRNKSVSKIHTLFNGDAFVTERDRSVQKIHPLKQGEYLAILADNNHWIYDRQMKTIVHHHEYPDDLQIRSCLEQKQNDFLTIGYKYNVFYFKNCLLS